jgi:hypothetical protein
MSNACQSLNQLYKRLEGVIGQLDIDFRGSKTEGMEVIKLASGYPSEKGAFYEKTCRKWQRVRER